MSNKVNADGMIVPMTDAEVAQLASATQSSSVARVVPPITNYQARAQLYKDNNFDAVDKAVRGSGDATAIAAWDYANVFERGSNFIAALKALTPYNTDALVDTFFANASKIS